MTLSDTHKAIMAAVGLLALGATSVGVFQTQAAAKEQAKQIEQKQAKSINELRAEIAMNRVGELNTKEAKEPLTPTERTERELLLEQVKALQAEKVAK